jgi:hypothetical protein
VAHPALAYAETQLGVHTVFQSAEQARVSLDNVYTELSKAGDSKRDLHDRIADQEMLIASDERGKHPDMSAAAMDKHLKVAFSKNYDHRELRDQLRKATGDVEGLEYDARILEYDLKIAIARMTELGGYLNYLAAVKNNTKPTQPTQPEQPTTPGEQQ